MEELLNIQRWAWKNEAQLTALSILHQITEEGCTITFNERMMAVNDQIYVMETATLRNRQGATEKTTSWCGTHADSNVDEVIEKARNMVLTALLGISRILPSFETYLANHEPEKDANDHSRPYPILPEQIADEDDFINEVGKCDDLNMLSDLYRIAHENNASDKVFKAIDMRSETLRNKQTND